VELENLKNRQERTVERLEDELNRFKELDEEREKLVVRKSEIESLQAEIDCLRDYLSVGVRSFLSHFFSVWNEKDEYYKRQMENEMKEKLQLEEKIKRKTTKEKRCVSLEAEIGELKGRLLKYKDTINKMEVEQKSDKITIKELEAHISKLEDEYNRREIEMDRLREEYGKAFNELSREKKKYEDRMDELRERIRKYDNKLKSNIVDEMIQKIGKETEDKMRQVFDENRCLRIDLDEMRIKMNRLERELEEAESMRELDSGRTELGTIELSPMLLNGYVKEKIVSSYIIDKDALKIHELKKMDGATCKTCSRECEKNGTEGGGETIENYLNKKEVERLSGELSLLNLKLEQSERNAQENKKLVDALRDCAIIARKTRKKPSLPS
jgi:DNA repair exonuclease SbcCD ATPase subunit